jgi:hypothetical protein
VRSAGAFHGGYGAACVRPLAWPNDLRRGPRRHAGIRSCRHHHHGGAAGRELGGAEQCVDKLEPYLVDAEILIRPFIVGDFLEVVFVRKHNTIFEYMRYLKDGWFGK